jgi:DNA modification methylase
MAYLMTRANLRLSIPFADKSFHCIVTSPPYFGQRDYGDPSQLGLESTPEQYISNQVAVFREARRVLRDDGCLFLNIGDSFASTGGHTAQGSTSQRKGRANVDHQNRVKGRVPAGIKPKNLIGIPWMLAFALRADGWYLRQEIIWEKPNSMPESVTDRPSRSHEQVFLLTKKPRYFYDAHAGRNRLTDDSIARNSRHKTIGVNPDRADNGGFCGSPLQGSNIRSVWTISTGNFPGAHFATMAPLLAARCIRLGSSRRGCCLTCLAPWVRILEKQRVPTRPGLATNVNGLAHEVVGNRDPLRHVTTVKLLGWQQSCSCPPAPPIPCRVFDPYGGSGTTVKVANKLGRDGFSTELSAEYIDMARARMDVGEFMRGVDRPSDRKTIEQRRPPPPGQVSLFDGVDLGSIDPDDNP